MQLSPPSSPHNRPQKGTRDSRHLPRALPRHSPRFTEAWVSTTGTFSQAADSCLFQDTEWAGHPGVLHGWLCGIPRFLPRRTWRPPERRGEGRTTIDCQLVACVLRMLWSLRNGHDSSERLLQQHPFLDTLFLSVYWTLIFYTL